VAARRCVEELDPALRIEPSSALALTVAGRVGAWRVRPWPAQAQKRKGLNRTIASTRKWPRAAAPVGEIDATLLTFETRSDRPVWSEQFRLPAVATRLRPAAQLPRGLLASKRLFDVAPDRTNRQEGRLYSVAAFVGAKIWLSARRGRGKSMLHDDPAGFYPAKLGRQPPTFTSSAVAHKLFIRA